MPLLYVVTVLLRVQMRSAEETDDPPGFYRAKLSARRAAIRENDDRPSILCVKEGIGQRNDFELTCFNFLAQYSRGAEIKQL